MGVWRAANPRLRSVGSFAGAGTSDQIICPICRHTEHEPSVWVGPGKVARPSVSGSGQREEAGLRSEAGLSATDVGPSTRGPERAEVCFLAPEYGLLLGSGADHVQSCSQRWRDVKLWESCLVCNSMYCSQQFDLCLRFTCVCHFFLQSLIHVS